MTGRIMRQRSVGAEGSRCSLFSLFSSSFSLVRLRGGGLGNKEISLLLPASGLAIKEGEGANHETKAGRCRGLAVLLILLVPFVLFILRVLPLLVLNAPPGGFRA